MEEGDLASARAVCMAILDRRPDAAHVHLLLGTIARRAGDVGAMRNHIRNARECDAPALALARLEYQLARSIGDNDAELEALDRLAGLEPDPGKRRRFAFDAFAKRAIAAGNAGDLEAAWTHIVEACALAPDLAFRKEVHAAVGEWIESDARQLPRLEEAFRANPRAAGLLWCLAVAYDLNAEVAKSRGLVQANWHWAGCLEPPADLQVWDFVDLSLVSPERADRSVRYKALLFENRLEEALHLAPTHHRRLLAEAVALSARGLASMAPARHPAQVMVSGEDRTRGTVFFFSGLREQVWMPAHVLDVFFAALGLRAVFLRDSGRLLFLGEAPGLGHGVDGIAVSLRAMAGPGPTCTMGISGGGVPALAYAGPLAAERSLVFSTPSTLDPDVLERMGDRRARAWIRRFASHVDPATFDGPSMLSRMSPDYRLTAYAPAEGAEDRMHAERLQGDPRLRLMLVSGTGEHDTMGHATEEARDGFLGILREALLGGAAGAEA